MRMSSRSPANQRLVALWMQPIRSCGAADLRPVEPPVVAPAYHAMEEKRP
jgi:hypothetical protein